MPTRVTRMKAIGDGANEIANSVSASLIAPFPFHSPDER